MISEEGWPMLECPKIDRDQVDMDTSGYWFLIRPNFEQGVIECAACCKDSSKPKNIYQIYYGRCAQDIYHYILNVNPLEGIQFATSMTHAAYLGKELKKCEIALALGLKDFYQE